MTSPIAAPAPSRRRGPARALFSLWQAYALAHGGPGVLRPFLVLEVSFRLAQLAPWAAGLRTATGRGTCQGS
jgi:hypothetical protein